MLQDGLWITKKGHGFRHSIFLDKEEYCRFLDALDDFWWRRRPGTWAKHLVKRNYKMQGDRHLVETDEGLVSGINDAR